MRASPEDRPSEGVKIGRQRNPGHAVLDVTMSVFSLLTACQARQRERSSHLTRGLRPEVIVPGRH